VIAAGAAGRVDGWLLGATDAALPRPHLRLLAEAALWQLPLLVLLFAIQRFVPVVRRRWPVFSPQNGGHFGPASSFGVPSLTSLAAGLLCAAVAAVFASVLIRSSANGQVIASLVIAFTAGAAAAQSVFPQPNPVGILLSPFLVAAGGYAYAAVRYPAHEALLSAWFNRELLGLALALPVFYASAAVAGCAMGVGLAQVMRHESHDPAAGSARATPAEGRG
jgi:hypothetical protein